MCVKPNQMEYIYMCVCVCVIPADQISDLSGFGMSAM